MQTAQEHSGVIRAAIQSAIDSLNVCIPARVASIADDSRVNVICEINRGRMLEDGTRVYNETTEIDNVPVVLMSCGGFSFNMPINEGCKGLLVFCDYDNDDWQEGIAKPHTARTHDLNDPFFFPAFNGSVITGDNLEIKTPTTTLVLGDGFDVIKDGDSLLDAISEGQNLDGFKP